MYNMLSNEVGKMSGCHFGELGAGGAEDEKPVLVSCSQPLGDMMWPPFYTFLPQFVINLYTVKYSWNFESPQFFLSVHSQSIVMRESLTFVTRVMLEAMMSLVPTRLVTYRHKYVLDCILRQMITPRYIYVKMEYGLFCDYRHSH